MTGSVRPAVEAIWVALGVGVPPEVIGARYLFTVEDTELELRLARDGRGIELSGRLGRLGARPMQAADQLRRLLRLGLALALTNRAALVLPAGADLASLQALARGDGGVLPDLLAVTAPDADPARDAVRAVQDVVQWRALARPILGEADPADPARAPARRVPSASPTAALSSFGPDPFLRRSFPPVTLSVHSDIARLVRKLLVDPSLADRLGLQPGDLNGAARQARADLLAGRSGEALGKFARLVLIDPAESNFHIGLAEAALAEGHAALAMQAAATVIVDRPDRPEGYLLSALASLALNEVQAAGALLSAAGAGQAFSMESRAAAARVIFNAAMLPGWPYPSSFARDGAGRAAPLRSLTEPLAKMTPEEMAQYLANLGVHARLRRQIKALLDRLEALDPAQMRGFMAVALAALGAVLAGLAAAAADRAQTALLAADLPAAGDDPPPPEGSGAPRRRLRL